MQVTISAIVTIGGRCVGLSSRIGIIDRACAAAVPICLQQAERCFSPSCGSWRRD
jgi:hypothetical protein